MAKTDNEKFSPNTILRISNLFESLKWEIDNEHPLDSSVFNRFCNMAAFLNAEQQDLVFDLTKRFLVVEMPDYMKLLSGVVSGIDNKLLKQEIILGPLVAPEDFEEIKSSIALIYYCRTFRIQHNAKFSGKNIVLHLSPKELLEDLKKRNINNVTVVLFDDYIGTGETAINATDFIVKETGLSRDNILILSVACQENGSRALTNIGIFNRAHHVLKKGISDFYNETLATQYLQIMREIERKLRVSSKFRLGYGGSEALVKMSRTPNNTFPIFWLESKKQNRFAPFPRD